MRIVYIRYICNSIRLYFGAVYGGCMPLLSLFCSCSFVVAVSQWVEYGLYAGCCIVNSL